MTAKIKYRVSIPSEGWKEDDVKGAPLTNQEIDKNWKTVVVELDNKADKNNTSLSGTVIVDSTTAFGLPAGTTDQRDQPIKPFTLTKGMLRFNTDKSSLEFYDGTSWRTMGKVATGGGDDQIFYLNDIVVTESYTIPNGKNALTAGPITLSSGKTVTVPEGSTWTIV